MRRFASLGGVLFLIVAAIFFFDIFRFYLWVRVPTATILRDGQSAPETALYQRDGELLLQDGLDYYLIDHRPDIVTVSSHHDFYQFHRNYLHCRYPSPRAVEMNGPKIETDPRLVRGDNQFTFTNLQQQRINVQW